ncbi:hypothetical protein UY3_03945 [Chelonia mydas]|uniref:Uncharacterized protein n=1 Tax=Chelonia mydas TaxID=8469 RepID=M7BLS8_CHEMY|nr:hypothetical protein UY3_03945 [Chelonia mydas]
MHPELVLLPEVCCDNLSKSLLRSVCTSQHKRGFSKVSSSFHSSQNVMQSMLEAGSQLAQSPTGCDGQLCVTIKESLKDGSYIPNGSVSLESILESLLYTTKQLIAAGGGESEGEALICRACWWALGGGELIGGLLKEDDEHKSISAKNEQQPSFCS